MRCVPVRAARPRLEIQEATIRADTQAFSRSRGTTRADRGYLSAFSVNGTCVTEPQGILARSPRCRARPINATPRGTFAPRPATRGVRREQESSPPTATPETPCLTRSRLQRAQQQFARTAGCGSAARGRVASKDRTTPRHAEKRLAPMPRRQRPAPDDAAFVKRCAMRAIVLAAKLAEYAGDGARSSFGGTFCIV